MQGLGQVPAPPVSRYSLGISTPTRRTAGKIIQLVNEIPNAA